MHREYRPDDMHHGHATGFGVIQADPADDERALIGFTVLLGSLIGLDVVLGALGWETGRFPLGLSPAMIAALLGAIYIVYGALQSLLHGRIGADMALAQACLAALIIGQPFVAAEVVFIALLGEVLEAWTFARTRRALGRLVEQTPRTARVRRDGHGGRGPCESGRDRRSGRRAARRARSRSTAIVVGRSTVDQSALTGESLPIDKGPGDPVFTGTINQFGAIEVNAEKVGDETTFGQVLRLVAQARRRKAQAREDRRPPGAVLPPGGRAGRRGDLAHRLSRRLARRLVADGGRAGRRLPVRAGARDTGRDARQHGLAGASRRADQGRLGARGPGRLRHVRLRQDRAR